MQVAWLLPSVLFGTYLGVTTGAWHMLAMSAGSAIIWFTAKRLNESREIDLTEPVTFAGAEVWIGEYQLPKYEIFWKKKWHAVVFAAYQSKDQAPVFELDLGLEQGVGHALIVGPTGSGKSQLMKLLLLRVMRSMENPEFTLIDFKGGATFTQLRNHAGVKVVASDIDGHDPVTLWHGITNEIRRRETVLASRSVTRIEDCETFGISLPRHYIFIDELTTALAESSLASPALSAIAARGRSLGMHLIAATQSTQGIPRAMLTNLRARIALSDSDPIELAQLNIKRPAQPIQTPPKWAQGIVQIPGAQSAFFNFPLGGQF